MSMFSEPTQFHLKYWVFRWLQRFSVFLRHGCRCSVRTEKGKSCSQRITRSLSPCWGTGLLSMTLLNSLVTSCGLVCSNSILVSHHDSKFMGSCGCRCWWLVDVTPNNNMTDFMKLLFSQVADVFYFLSASFNASRTRFWEHLKFCAAKQMGSFSYLAHCASTLYLYTKHALQPSFHFHLDY
jgi:hypothetical protein